MNGKVIQYAATAYTTSGLTATPPHANNICHMCVQQHLQQHHLQATFFSSVKALTESAPKITAPQQLQNSNSSATALQQLRNSSRTAPEQQQLQNSNSSATAPQQLQNSSRTATAPEQQQLYNSSATAPEQQQLRNRSRTALQQLSNSSATAPQQLGNSSAKALQQLATVPQQLSQLNNTSIKSCSTFQINSTYRASATTATLSTPMVLIAISTAATTLA